jgi:hypothetical protein
MQALLGAEVEPYDKQAENEPWEDLFERVTDIDPRMCPHCGKGKMVLKEILEPEFSRPPP